MKKIIAVMLMMTLFVTTAFAADFTPGEQIKIDENDTGVWGDQTLDYEISTTYYSIAGITWDKGKELVSSVNIDNDENVFVINLRQDYQSKKDKTLRGTIKVRDKKNGRFLTMNINCQIGYTQGTIDIGPDGSIATLIVDPETVYTVTASDKSYPYGTLMFQADEADVSVRVYDKEVFFLGYNREPNRQILMANSESDAVMEFLNFEANPTFSGTATVHFYGLEDDTHIYEIKNDRLIKSGAKWDEESDSFILKTRTLGSYVISDMTLRGASSNTDNDDTDNDGAVNPDTGANDIAGIAAALAAVSLISAAAIGLKKS